MNVVREINRINERELDLAPGQGSWHDQYKDSAYIFIGGLNYELTEGDVITVFSQYGEVVDIDMPREKSTGKRRGFAFLMYEDQRSTVLAVDNLNGAELAGRTLRVDHVQNYKQKELVDGKWVDRETERLNVKPELLTDEREEESDASQSSLASVDKEDPMRDYLIEQKREKAKKKSKKHPNETPEERRARKERKRAKKLAKEERRMITDRPRHSSRERRSESSRRRSPDRHRDKMSYERSVSPRNDKQHRRSRSPRRHRDNDERRRHDSDRRYD
ncbi:RNA-binding motif protein, X-linked 2 [Serendipita indica DSM 11827]|uniref:Related to RNA-binding proteins n=1 Tax=Serendipita indica (strain DSM 11827) TaxID=1109443 RepID=G4TRP5_SERID|nr:RNA-binding motif protein, X-linked 2 [Serendipita indica DSM 11827]CCA73988.1 related to RNA-binding proteins [Serendipita indica DSM 11827]